MGFRGVRQEVVREHGAGGDEVRPMRLPPQPRGILRSLPRVPVTLMIIFKDLPEN